MIKYAFALTFICLAAACGQSSNKSTTTVHETRPNDIVADEPVDPRFLIVPGVGVGFIKLDEDADSVMHALGKPDKGDAAMGAQLLTWYNNHDTTSHLISVYSHRNFGGKDENISHVKAIRITSPQYQTSKFIHTGSPLDSIRKLYHAVSKIPQCGNYVYDDIKKGIAFEVDGSKCKAIIVHAAGDSAGAYLNLRQ